MHRNFPRHTFKSSGFLVLLSALFVGAFALGAVASEKKKGGGGGIRGGIGITIDVSPLFNQPSKPKPRPETRRTSCRKPLVYSKGRCICPTNRGYVYSRGRCIPRRPPTEVVIQTPPVDVTRVQECLQKTNFDPGPVDGSAGRQTLDAFRRFQEANGLGNRPASLTDKESTQRLFELCETVTASPAPTVPTRQAASPLPPQQDNCLPQDLHDMLTASYGDRPGIRACSNACLPKPESFSDSRIQSLQAQHGINWCDSCVRFSGWLPLADILNIERMAGITMCATPLSQCVLPASQSAFTQAGYPRVRTIFKKLPTSIRKDGDLAVIIGNESYESLPTNVNGLREASAVRTLLEEQLGYRAENIIDLRNAKLAEIEDVFGTASNEGFLAQQLADKDKGDLFVYVASHGLASKEQNRGYILPVDAAFDPEGKGAYGLQQLYDSLSKLGARTITLALEVTFNTEPQHLIDPPNLPQLSSSVLPDTTVPGLAVFTAADRDQQTLEDPEYGIGLFTRYLIEGLAGQADEQPIGNADKYIDTVELYVYTANLVRRAARKTQGLEQKPLLAKHDNLLIGRLGQRQ